MSRPRNQILNGDALQRLKELPDGWVDQIVTSPPYFRLRDYGTSGQFGLEETVEDYVATLRACVAAMRRVLMATGTLWLNLGDSYSLHASQGAARKSLLGVPERVLLALIEDGWTLRNKIIWAKTNPIPTSVADRLATTHEVIYVLATSSRYYFDLDAIRQPHRTPVPDHVRRHQTHPAHRKRSTTGWLGPNGDSDDGLAALKARGMVGHPLGKNPGDVWQISPSHFRGAHFATYPETLVRPMIRAGCPHLRCSRCRAPYAHTITRTGTTATRQPERPTCRCNSPPEPGLVLDPFLGSGTTAVVAKALGRDWLGIELNPEYVQLAEARIAAARHSTNATPLKGGTS
ncbi:DNA modification methylase [Raineyella antarctica]|uniref:Methyltransferase n=1 Tax=Raineyella antarctica TaxID=1577474 RepID=A0A1G6H044_9ACTN|nr:site-specific DNA-methyltransferase [Raineyella antarctica]SDB87305.1 DNA modification methylase [Raineyella antarctica]